MVDQPGSLGELRVASEVGGTRAEVAIPAFLLPRAEGAVVPDIVIAIDFGTSGTSVAARVMSDGPDAVFLGPSRRFPSAVFVPDTEDPSTWLYGERAVQAEQARRPGVLIENIKTLLRRPQGNPEVPEPVAILTWLLERLLVEWIVPHVRKKLPDPEPENVAFVVTLPVLDGMEEYELQRRLTLAAVREAGYEAWGSIRTLLEPEAALLSVAQGFTGGPGRNVVIYDSGAGTTDVTFARVVAGNGTFALSDVSSSSLQFTEKFECGSIPNPDIGGETVTMLLGPVVAKAWQFRNPGESEERASGLLSTLESEIHASQKAPPTTAGWTPNQFHVGRSWFPPSASAWHRVLKELVRRFNQAKIRLARAIEEGDYAAAEFLIPEKQYTRIGADDVVAAAQLFNKLAIPKLVSDLGESGFKPDSVCCVGGNCHLLPIRAAVHEKLLSATALEPEDRILAVVRGALASSDRLYDPLGYELRVEARFGGNSVGVLLVDPEHGGVPKTGSKTLRDVRSLAFQIQIGFAENSGCFQAILVKLDPIPSPLGVRAALEGRTVRLSVLANEEELWTTTVSLP